MHFFKLKARDRQTIAALLDDPLLAGYDKIAVGAFCVRHRGDRSRSARCGVSAVTYKWHSAAAAAVVTTVNDH